MKRDSWIDQEVDSDSDASSLRPRYNRTLQVRPKGVSASAAAAAAQYKYKYSAGRSPRHNYRRIPTHEGHRRSPAKQFHGDTWDDCEDRPLSSDPEPNMRRATDAQLKEALVSLLDAQQSALDLLHLSRQRQSEASVMASAADRSLSFVPMLRNSPLPQTSTLTPIVNSSGALCPLSLMEDTPLTAGTDASRHVVDQRLFAPEPVLRAVAVSDPMRKDLTAENVASLIKATASTRPQSHAYYTLPDPSAAPAMRTVTVEEVEPRLIGANAEPQKPRPQPPAVLPPRRTDPFEAAVSSLKRVESTSSVGSQRPAVPKTRGSPRSRGNGPPSLQEYIVV